MVFKYVEDPFRLWSKEFAQRRISTRKIVAAARHYAFAIQTCVPADPQSKGGSEATVHLAFNAPLPDPNEEFARPVKASA